MSGPQIEDSRDYDKVRLLDEYYAKAFDDHRNMYMAILNPDSEGFASGFPVLIPLEQERSGPTPRRQGGGTLLPGPPLDLSDGGVG